MTSVRTLRVNYMSTDAAGEARHGTRDLDVDEAVALFRSFDGSAASLYVIVDDRSLIGWYKHGDLMYEVNLWNHENKRRRFGQVPTEFAEECLRRLFDGDTALSDLEEHSFLYSAGAWDAAKDTNYWLARDTAKWA